MKTSKEKSHQQPVELNEELIHKNEKRQVVTTPKRRKRKRIKIKVKRKTKVILILVFSHLFTSLNAQVAYQPDFKVEVVNQHLKTWDFTQGISKISDEPFEWFATCADDYEFSYAHHMIETAILLSEHDLIARYIDKSPLILELPGRQVWEIKKLEFGYQIHSGPLMTTLVYATTTTSLSEALFVAFAVSAREHVDALQGKRR